MTEERTKVSNMEEIHKKRLEKYAERIHDKPQSKNQLLFKEGQAVCIRNGQVFSCNKVEGYVKLPDMAHLQSLDLVNMAVFFLPKHKMIIRAEDNVYFRGFQKNNTPDCIFLLHVAGEYYDVLVADISDNIPALVAVDDGEYDDIVNPISYQIMEYLMKKEAQVCDTVDVLVEGDDDDEWE